MVKATPIPERARSLVRGRARHRCERCAVPAPSGQWHHRRSRSVRDSHTHCPCNGVWLCPTCHQWAHANPAAAQRFGWIVPRATDEPGRVAMLTPLGWRMNDCEGAWQESL